jgi:hypothetical protein
MPKFNIPIAGPRFCVLQSWKAKLYAIFHLTLPYFAVREKTRHRMARLIFQ